MPLACVSVWCDVGCAGVWCVVLSLARHDTRHVLGVEECDDVDGGGVCVRVCEAAYETTTGGSSVGSTGPRPSLSPPPP